MPKMKNVAKNEIVLHDPYSNWSRFWSWSSPRVNRTTTSNFTQSPYSNYNVRCLILFTGSKCWTKGRLKVHQISKLQLLLECVCVLHWVWNSISLMEAEHAITHFSHFPRQTWRQLPKSHIGACITYLFATILYWGNIPTCYNSTYTVTICCNTVAALQVCSIVALQNYSNAKTSITVCTHRPVCLGGSKHCGQSKCMLWRIEEWWDQYVV